MLPKDLQKKEDLRLSGQARSPEAKVPTYQESLDDALDNTFPASDPPANSVATRVQRPVATGRDEHDWTLKPGASAPAPEPQDGEARRLKAQSEAAIENVREGFERPIDDTPARPGRFDGQRPPTRTSTRG